MKKILLIITLLCTGNLIFSQQIPAGAISVETSYLGDLVANKGGLSSGNQYLGMANIVISFNTKNLGLWPNGSVMLNAANTHGGTPTERLSGDFQGVSNIEAGDHTYIQELWYSHSLDNFYLTAGLQDLAVEFAVSEVGAHFLNGSFGVHSTLADNVPSPIFPITALGAQAGISFSDELTFKTGIFDGMPEDFESNPYNIKWRLSKDQGFLSISEVNFSSELFSGLKSTYKFGGYYHNHIHKTDEDENNFIDNNYGFYFVADQEFISNDEHILNAFSQISVSPETKNENNFYLGAGLTYSGLFNRPDDVLGLAVAHAGFKNSVRENETVFELSYLVQITSFLSIQPDVQYIINPAGTEQKLDNALVGILRFGLNF